MIAKWFVALDDLGSNYQQLNVSYGWAQKAYRLACKKMINEIGAEMCPLAYKISKAYDDETYNVFLREDIFKKIDHVYLASNNILKYYLLHIYINTITFYTLI